VALEKETAMSKRTRITVLAMSLVSLLGVTASTASAVTWTNTTDTTFTATGGAFTLSAGATNLTCSGVDLAGTSPHDVSGGIAVVASGTTFFTGCRLAGVVTTGHCSFAFTADLISSGVVFGNADVTCDLYEVGRRVCHVEGPTVATYTNPESGSRGIFAFPHSSTQTVTDVDIVRCRLGNNVPVTKSAAAFTVTSGTGGPTIRRDP
jgi:hypothetical protein